MRNLEEIVKKMKEANVSELEVDIDGLKIKIKLPYLLPTSGQPIQKEVKPQAEEVLIVIRSPFVGWIIELPEKGDVIEISQPLFKIKEMGVLIEVKLSKNLLTLLKEEELEKIKGAKTLKIIEVLTTVNGAVQYGQEILKVEVSK